MAGRTAGLGPGNPQSSWTGRTRSLSQAGRQLEKRPVVLPLGPDEESGARILLSYIVSFSVATLADSVIRCCSTCSPRDFGAIASSFGEFPLLLFPECLRFESSCSSLSISLTIFKVISIVHVLPAEAVWGFSIRWRAGAVAATFHIWIQFLYLGSCQTFHSRSCIPFLSLFPLSQCIALFYDISPSFVYFQ
jgi:hypothetical protein